jgi:hypothetical protein
MKLTGQLQQHIETLVTRAQAISTLAVLRILNLCHAHCATLVEDLRSYDLALSSGPSASLANTPISVGTGGGKGSGGGAGPLASMLEHALEEMFVPWLEGSRYLESESKNLVELYGGLLSRFTRYHVSCLPRHIRVCWEKAADGLGNRSQGQAQLASRQSSQSALLVRPLEHRGHHCRLNRPIRRCRHFQIRQLLYRVRRTGSQGRRC